MIKSLKDISWLVTEPEYRQDASLSYSTISTYERGGGFSCISSLKDRKESPSLTFGSMVDALITGGRQEFDDHFIVAEFPTLSDAMTNIVRHLFLSYSDTYNDISAIPQDLLAMAWNIYDKRDWKAATKAKNIIDNGAEYYRLLFLAGGKTVVSTDTYNRVLRAVDALKTSDATSYYFQADTPFENIERLYQLKFKAVIDNVPYRCMFDELLIDYDNKFIQPIDLKTSSHKTYEFYKSLIDWSYWIQAMLYTRILRENILKDSYFKDFTLKPYIFIVASNCDENPLPLTWLFKESTSCHDFRYTDARGFEHFHRNPLTIGAELYHYLQTTPLVPDGMSLTKPNDIIDFLTKC